MDAAMLSSAIERCYDAALNPGSWPSALHDIATSFEGHGATLLRLSGQAPPLVSYSPAMSEFAPAYEALWWEHDTYAIYARKHRLGPGLDVDTEYILPELRARDPFYQDFRRPQKVSSVLSFVSTSVGEGMIAINVQRRLDAEHVPHEARLHFGLLGRHLAKAIALSSRLSIAEGMNRGMGEQLAGFDCAVALIGADGRVLRQNAMLHLLEADGVLVRHDKLVHQNQDAQRRFDIFVAQLLSAEAGALPPDVLALPRPNSALPLLVRGISLSASLADRQFEAGHSTALLLILRPNLPGYPPLEPMLIALGLTRGQARVAAAIGGGHSLAETASLCSITEDTARTHLKQIYSRLGINRQSQLARLLAKVAPLHR